MSILNLFGKREKDKNEFKFTESENKAVFTCSHVLMDKSPILYVIHDNDGDWQFLCGKNNHTEEDAKVISLKQVTELDISLNDLYEMPMGVGAERTAIGDKWTSFKIPTD